MVRISCKLVGQSGSGLLSIGDILIRSLKNAGFFICAERENPSLIKGGFSSYQIDISDTPISALTQKNDIIVALDRVGSMTAVTELTSESIFLYGDERADLVPGFSETLQKSGCKHIFIPERETVEKLGGNDLFSNMLFLGLLWKVLGLNYSLLAEEVTRRYGTKPAILKIDLACLEFGFSSLPEPILRLQPDTSYLEKAKKNIILDGSEIVSLSAIHYGVRAYFAYPMSPSSGVLAHLSEWAEESGMVVVQAEDEISVVQMTLGSSYAGTRALCATSGGGFDLMVETISLAGMIETPLVIIDAQRPGPATGLPTRTAQGDLLMAIHSGHGEFARMVISLSDPESSFRLLGEAFDFAEKFQIPVIVLTEKTLMETKMTINPAILVGVNIEHDLEVSSFKFQVSSEDSESTQNSLRDPQGMSLSNTKLKTQNFSGNRYELTPSGISPRWLPGSDGPVYFANGDEHREDGTLTEDPQEVASMVEKRLRKMETLKMNIPKPRIFETEKLKNGKTDQPPLIAFVGFGSTLPVMQDVIREAEKLGISVTYLHYDFLWPLDRESFLEFTAERPNIHAIEGNATGQLASLIDPFDEIFVGKFLKYDGRRFYIEDILQYTKLKIQNSKFKMEEL